MLDTFKMWMALDQLHSTLNQELEHFLKSNYNLTVSEFMTITRLSDAPDHGLTIDQLSKMVNLSHSAVSRLVVRLETCHTIERRSNEQDRRSTLVQLSESGKRDYQAILPGIVSVIQDVMKRNPVAITLS
ncbi:hypothetical protein B1A99_25935 [Cohnella sp. CIP 111063]|uniref:MarR family winged helix-turn-helix transcriptional regulator n=1 Tax=unclassified Cohnella TaxID=2636738 RepID=UPI000B8BE6D0|nr:MULTISPECIES: MarR family transcriptional regulator [unclassified Cohnella]OXS54768.1 hypothetical protein B1A99_25935 [Cohnella sp. CIP 111063]PRX64606.1 DNA-binding MarR family transcriptional regulator [Cohnella sp. SGD-V74]